jgi:hypothetical protein
MFTSSLTEEVKALEDEIQAVMNKVEDPVICTKIRQFVYSSRETQTMYKENARGCLRIPRTQYWSKS